MPTPVRRALELAVPMTPYRFAIDEGVHPCPGANHMRKRDGKHCELIFTAKWQKGAWNQDSNTNA